MDSLFLRSLAKLHDLGIPLVRNQNTIIKQLMTHRKDIFEHAYIEEGTDPVIAAKRHNLLAKEVCLPFCLIKQLLTSVLSHLQAGSELFKYHLELLGLLAVCAEGDNRYIESMCQTLYSIDELIEVLEDRSIDAIHKTAFLEYVHDLISFLS
jgi:hypothetical protein